MLIWKFCVTSAPDHPIKNSRALSSVQYARNEPTPNSTTDDATKKYEYRFSRVVSAGTMKRQMFHSTTGNAITTPPHAAMRMRAAKPSIGPRA